MRRLEKITEIVCKSLEQKCYGYKLRLGYRHLFGVSTLCILIAKKRNLDEELAGCIGILHDYATYYTNTSFDHAHRSSMLAKDILINSELFTDDEIEIITKAIFHHSNKETIDDIYSELIKDADVAERYLHKDGILNKEAYQRIHILKEQEIL